MNAWLRTGSHVMSPIGPAISSAVCAIGSVCALWNARTVEDGRRVKQTDSMIRTDLNGTRGWDRSASAGCLGGANLPG